MYKTSLSISLCVLLFISSCNPEETSTLSRLETVVKSKLSTLEGDFAVAYKSLDDPQKKILINAYERFHAASTMKTPVMIEVYKQAGAGRFDVRDSITIINEFKSIVDGSLFSMEVNEDSEKDLYTNLNKKVSIYHLTYEMIIRSSNLATNVLIDLLDAKKVSATMRSLGADSIEVLRGVEDIKAYRQGLSNTTTARDLMIIFEQLGTDTLISAEANEEMIEILKDQKYNDMIPALLPEKTEVAHKTGWITNVHHDSGIVYTKSGKRFVLIFLSKNAPDREAVLKTGAEISKLFYDFTEKI